MIFDDLQTKAEQLANQQQDEVLSRVLAALKAIEQDRSYDPWWEEELSKRRQPYLVDTVPGQSTSTIITNPAHIPVVRWDGPELKAYGCAYANSYWTARGLHAELYYSHLPTNDSFLKRQSCRGRRKNKKTVNMSVVKKLVDNIWNMIVTEACKKCFGCKVCGMPHYLGVEVRPPGSQAPLLVSFTSLDAMWSAYVNRTFSGPGPLNGRAKREARCPAGFNLSGG